MDMAVSMTPDYQTTSLMIVLQSLVSLKPSRVLVVGCGTGHEAGIISRHFNVETVGIDIGTDFAFDHDKAHPAKLVTMDAQALSFPSGSFDFVYSFHSLEHISNPQRALAEMSRVLTDGGAYVIGTPNKSRLLGYIGGRSSLQQKVIWNIADYRYRIRGQWDNSYGAHAGFYARELFDLAESYFGNCIEISDEYYRERYRKHAKTLNALRLVKNFIYPCVYVAGRKTTH